MSVRVVMDEYDEFARTLTTLPATLTEAAKTPVKVAADETMTELLAGYPEKTGAMKAGVTQVVIETTADYAVDVRSTSMHAVWWEYGTKIRKTQKGFNRGSEQGARDKSLHVIADKHQSSLATALTAILQANGFEVDGGQ